MALKVVTMAELRREVLIEAERTGLTVTEICRRYGISRQTYYRYRRRYLSEGLAGLEDRSRRPLAPATQIPAELDLRIVEMRRVHVRDSNSWRAFDPPQELTMGRRNEIVGTGSDLVVCPSPQGRATSLGATLDLVRGARTVLPRPPEWPAIPHEWWAVSDSSSGVASPLEKPAARR